MPALTEAPPTWESRMSPREPGQSCRQHEGDEDGAVRADAGQSSRGGLAPMAYIERPYVVYRRMTKNTITTAAKM